MPIGEAEASGWNALEEIWRQEVPMGTADRNLLLLWAAGKVEQLKEEVAAQRLEITLMRRARDEAVNTGV